MPLDQGFACRVYAYHMVVRFMAGGQCGTSGSGVGDEAVGAIGFREAGVLGVVQPELAPVGGPSGIHVHKAHAVADHEDHVLYFLSGRGD